MRSILLVVCTCASLLSVPASGDQASPARGTPLPPSSYHVRVKTTPLEALVRGTLPIAGTRLAMDQTQADRVLLRGTSRQTCKE